MGDLDLPFEEIPGEPLRVDMESYICGGLVVRAAGVETTEGPKAALVFDFYLADGVTLPHILYVADDDQMEKVPKLVADAVESALRAVRASRS